ncbi:unnamed protein product [Alopecurus aequalis]
MSKRRCQREEGQANCHDRSGNKHKSLYLVLDDWHGGFTIRKLDADSPDLSTPPVLRLASPVFNCPMDFAALGGNIIATSNLYAATLVFDAETAAVAMGNPLPDSLLNAANYFLTAGDVLYAFAYYFMLRPQSFHVLTTTNDDMNTLCPSSDWSWKSMPAPFTKDERIASYALHPDGQTIFVSSYISEARRGTFSFDTKNREWTRHGDWMLPFDLEGYFDAELDAWVGLPDGYICSCQVPSLSSSSSSSTLQQQPDWKMAKEHKMWSPQHQLAKGKGPTLTYMGNSRFFLVDCVAADGFKFQDAFGDSRGCVINMTTFRLSYDREGNLRIKDRNTTSCPLSKQLASFSPVAFWM